MIRWKCQNNFEIKYAVLNIFVRKKNQTQYTKIEAHAIITDDVLEDGTQGLTQRPSTTSSYGLHTMSYIHIQIQTPYFCKNKRPIFKKLLIFLKMYQHSILFCKLLVYFASNSNQVMHLEISPFQNRFFFSKLGFQNLKIDYGNFFPFNMRVSNLIIYISRHVDYKQTTW